MSKAKPHFVQIYDIRCLFRFDLSFLMFQVFIFVPSEFFFLFHIRFKFPHGAGVNRYNLIVYPTTISEAGCVTAALDIHVWDILSEEEKTFRLNNKDK